MRSLDPTTTGKKRPGDTLEDIAFDYIAGRRRFEPRSRYLTSHSARISALQMNDELFANDAQYQNDGSLKSALLNDASIMLNQARQILWFLPQRAWTPAALASYAAVAFSFAVYLIWASAAH